VLKKDIYKFFINTFELKYPNPTTELVYDNDYQLLIAVMLSAQCTDKRVNSVTPFLFREYKNFNQLSKANLDDVFALIKSISYPRNKSKYLIKSSKIIYKNHKGKVPDSFNSLIDLPGVGRKTANVILSVLFNQPRMPVDTHVFRVSRRIGLASNVKSFLKVENQLVANLPKEKITKAHHWLILHGRYVCKAINPNCTSCDMKKVCKFYDCS
tara:strand:+ start:564 stop:1199 length:636 start_codon:yes stop_codon:yes gene_type:complete